MKFSIFTAEKKNLYTAWARFIMEGLKLCLTKTIYKAIDDDSWFVHSIKKSVRKPTTCIGKNKGTDQLCSNCTADQCLCIGSTDSTITLLLKSEISSFLPASKSAQAGLCKTWLETKFVGFHAKTYLVSCIHHSTHMPYFRKTCNYWVYLNNTKPHKTW